MICYEGEEGDDVTSSTIRVDEVTRVSETNLLGA